MGCGLLVMLSCHFKFPQKDIGVPQVAVCSSLCCTVAKFLSYEQALHKERDIATYFIVSIRITVITEANKPWVFMMLVYGAHTLYKHALIMKGGYTPAREKLQLCESSPTSSACSQGCHRFDPEQRDPQDPSLLPSLPWKYTYSQCCYDCKTAERHCIINMSRAHITSCAVTYS